MQEKRHRGIRILAAMMIFAVLPSFASAAAPDSEPTAGFDSPSAQIPVHLYFAAPDHSFLTAEEKVLPKDLNPEALGRAILDALIAGPQQKLMRTLPEQTTVRGFYITEDRTAYVDFDESVRDRHPGGCHLEKLTVYSIVNSLVLNIDQVETVKILIGGGEAETLAGHIDIRFPFRADMLTIR